MTRQYLLTRGGLVMIHERWLLCPDQVAISGRAHVVNGPDTSG